MKSAILAIVFLGSLVGAGAIFGLLCAFGMPWSSAMQKSVIFFSVLAAFLYSEFDPKNSQKNRRWP